ncbi:MAG TPA: bifunctional 4-hydroxy-2-oxoglutarate aldolase/2-dehydro-3-deoxy-phosphogluconate aldolase [Aliidongia sp.]|nr:bifunctional 4-hydroxy-2-oxoglutarate aldolase/2-dehydro-3-deoxy-phosphogluconate aldolase [Aliidongia sp.]
MPHSFDRHPVIPVLILERAEDAIPTAEALLEGGLSVIEITLRTPHSLEAIKRIAAKLPEMHVGAGTVLRPTDVTASKNAGAQFLVSPGLTTDLAAAGIASGLPYLPGAVTPTEIMAAREFGFSFLKFFPAREFGGPAMLRNYASVFPGIAFCPTGGIADAEAASAYLALPNVPVVGGTWIAPRDAITARDWAGIAARAREAAALSYKPQ